MRLTPRYRKLAVTSHVVASVGWLGAVAGYLAIAIAGLTSSDPRLVQSAYLMMGMTGWTVLVPLSLAALGTGLLLSFGTEWGLFRHRWVVTKLALTIVGVIILVQHMRTAVSTMAAIAAEAVASSPGFAMLQRSLVIHAAGGLLLLLTTTTLSIYRPWGRTAYGSAPEGAPAPKPYAMLAILGVLLILILLQLAGGGMRHH